MLVFIHLTPGAFGPAGKPLDYTLDNLPMTHRTARVRWDEIALEKVTEMVSRKAVKGASIELVQMYFKKGALVPLHRHESERIVYVLQGGIRFIVDGAELILREGEVLVLRAGTSRQAEILDDTFLMLVGG